MQKTIPKCYTGEHGVEATLVRMKEDIERCGTSVIGVMDNPTFSYTTGLLEKFNHPEIIIFGLHPEVAQEFLNLLRDRIADGETFEEGKDYDEIAHGFTTRFVEVDDAKGQPDYFGAGLRYYKHYQPELAEAYQAIQLVYPDAENRFPWDEGYDLPKNLQPLLNKQD